MFFFNVLSSNSCETDAGDERGIVKTVHKCLNKSVVQKTISKQEAMCELAKLPMVTCPETIETVGLSIALKLSNNSHTIPFLSKYKKRTTHYELPLHQYFHLIKNRFTRTKL